MAQHHDGQFPSNSSTGSVCSGTISYLQCSHMGMTWSKGAQGKLKGGSPPALRLRKIPCYGLLILVLAGGFVMSPLASSTD